MSFLNYALPPTEYNLKNSLLWGNFRGHVEKACYGTWEKRTIHVIICILEFLPIISQIASIFEMIIVLGCLDRFRARQAEMQCQENDRRLQVANLVVNTLNEGENKENHSPKYDSPIKEPGEAGEPDEEIPEQPDPLANLPDTVPQNLSKEKTPTVSPANSDLSDTPSTDSETPVSIPITASMQLEKARLDVQNSCIIA